MSAPKSPLCEAKHPDGMALPCQLPKEHGGDWHESSDGECLSKWAYQESASNSDEVHPKAPCCSWCWQVQPNHSEGCEAVELAALRDVAEAAERHLAWGGSVQADAVRAALEKWRGTAKVPRERCLGCGYYRGEVDEAKGCDGGNGTESHVFVEVDAQGMSIQRQILPTPSSEGSI